jgi:hypothetical protein
MSVDDRLREAFVEVDETWNDLAPAVLVRITARRRRESLTRWAAGVAAAAAAAAVVVALVTNPTGNRDQRPSDDPSQSPTQGMGTATGPLEGIWTSEPLTAGDVRDAARRAGDAASADAMLRALPRQPFRVELTVTGTSLKMTLLTPNKREVSDAEVIDIQGDRLELTPRFAEGHTTYTWAIVDGTLTMDFVSTTEGRSSGAPGEAWHRLFCDTSDFSRT